MAHIRGVNATAGMLQNASVEFAKGLNCIIGSRGTCKSTLIESIRFAFDVNHGKIKQLIAEQTDKAIESQAGLIRNCLKSGTVRCEVAVTNGHCDTPFTIEREVEGPPRTFKNGVLEYSKSDILEMVEIYSQGDLQKIAENRHPEMRLELIDRPNKARINCLRNEQKEALGRLVAMGPRLRALRIDIASKKQTTKVLPELRQQLDGLRAGRPGLPPNLESSHRMAQARKSALQAFSEAIEAVEEAVDHLQGTNEFVERIQASTDKLSKLKEPRVEDAVASLRRIEKLLVSLSTHAETIDSASLSESHRELEEHFERDNAEYYRLRQEQQLLNESLKKEETLRTQIEHLEHLEGELDLLQCEYDRLMQEREQNRSIAKAKAAEIFNLRLAEIEKINEKHSDFVVLTLTSGRDTGHYEQKLNELLSRSRIRMQEQVSHDLVSFLSPSELIDLVEISDANKLAEILSRDLGQMTRVVSHLSDHPELYQLESELFEDRLDITMYDAGVPKPVENLSEGQKATALLPLILRPAPYPLLFDQPEDDLDNSFIYKSLITVVRELKRDRQLIFVTHNANIPVLGDADRVIVMSMKDPELAAQPVTGTVDDCKREILELLEGGKQAFKEREARYGPLLRSA